MVILGGILDVKQVAETVDEKETRLLMFMNMKISQILSTSFIRICLLYNAVDNSSWNEDLDGA